MSARPKCMAPQKVDISDNLLFDLSALTLATEGVLRDNAGVPKRPIDIMPDVNTKLTGWIHNGHVRIVRAATAASHNWVLTYHVSFFAGTTDRLTGKRSTEPQGPDWSNLKQVMQQPPFGFRFNPSTNEWYSNVGALPQWVHAAIGQRYNNVLRRLAVAADVGGDMAFFRRDDDGYWSASCFFTFIGARPEMKYVLEQGLDFEPDKTSNSNEPDHRHWIRRQQTPLPTELYDAIQRRKAEEARRRREQEQAEAERARQAAARAAIEAEARAGRLLLQRQEEERMQRILANQRRRAAMHEQYQTDGPDAVSEEDKQWYKETFAEAIEDGLSKAVLSLQEDYLKTRLSRLPASSDAKKVRLKYWQMAKIANVVLDFVADMTDEVLEAFERAGLDPVYDADKKTVKLKATLDLPVQTQTVEIYVRTTVSAALAAQERRSDNKRAAISWSMRFQQGIDRDAVNQSLAKAGYTEQDGNGQIQIRGPNTLNAACNGLWEYSMTEETKEGAHLWNLNRPDVRGAAVLSTAVARPRASKAPPAPAPPKSYPGVPEGFRPKSRKL